MTNVEKLWTHVEAVRTKKPLVHNITNLVVMNTNANALLALGAAPAMIHAPEEVGEFVGFADALVINVGTVYSDMAAGMRLAVARANEIGKPWVLDPVAAGVVSYRKALCLDLIKQKPAVLRGNASEILALSGGSARGRGVDSADPAEAATQAAIDLARTTGAIVAVTGEVDTATDGERVVRVAGGDVMLTLVTGMGCSLSAAVGAFVGAVSDRLEATTAALALWAVAAEVAMPRSTGPGTFQGAFLDALRNLDRATFLERAKVS